jgi:Na+/H+ antiporter NhaD/arsenite permease-like protein
MIAGAIFFYFIFAKVATKKITVEPEPIISIVPSILLLLMIAGLAVCSFILNSGVTLASGLLVLILGIVSVVWYGTRFTTAKQNSAQVKNLIFGLDWETILFLIGIFIVIGALSETGLLGSFALFLSNATGGNVLLGFVIIFLVSIIISGFVDNVPYIIAMLPVISVMAADLGMAKELYMFALLIGSCLGGNLTPFGASANIVAVGILKKEGIQLNFWGWLKIGVPFTFITTTAAALFLWFIWRG